MFLVIIPYIKSKLDEHCRARVASFSLHEILHEDEEEREEWEEREEGEERRGSFSSYRAYFVLKLLTIFRFLKRTFHIWYPYVHAIYEGNSPTN